MSSFFLKENKVNFFIDFYSRPDAQFNEKLTNKEIKQ